VDCDPDNIPCVPTHLPRPFAGDSGTGSAGWFNRTFTLYSDTECTTPKISFVEQGTQLAGKLTGTGEVSTEFQRWAPAVSVTGYGDYVTTLNLQCPCGSVWEAGEPRRLTTCAGCGTPGWYANVSIGTLAYGTMRRLKDGQNPDDLLFSRPTTDEQEGPTLLLDGLGGLAFVNTDSSCPFDTPSYDYCGQWNQQCSAAATAADSAVLLLLTGEGEADGSILMYRTLFTPGMGCDSEFKMLTIEAMGCVTHPPTRSRVMLRAVCLCIWLFGC
jgi:hypothetical protein